MLGRTPPSAPSTKVTRRWDEYDPAAWMYLVESITKEYGKTGPRWQWVMNNELSAGNAWAVDFHFKDPHDAVIFQLKY